MLHTVCLVATEELLLFVVLLNRCQFYKVCIMTRPSCVACGGSGDILGLGYR